MQKYRSLVLPFAIVMGLLFHHYIAFLRFLVPYLIFTILFLNFTSLKVSKLKVSMMNFWLLIFQIVVSIGCYFAICSFDEIIAQGILVGVLSPVAASVVVISCLLGANRETITTHTLLGNAMVAILAPIYFSFIGNQVDMPFWESVGLISAKIFPIIVLPLFIALFTQKFTPKVNQFFIKYQIASFYLWALALTITLGQTIDFMFLHGSEHIHVIVWLGLASMIACAVQFAYGKWVGKKYGDTIAGGQGLGQRNTALGIWMAYTYLDPLSSIFPAFYSIWQNLFNSYQMWKHDRAKSDSKELRN